jgi:DNA-binding transcriptional LysR family regulator
MHMSETGAVGLDWTYRLRLRNLQMLLSLAHTGNMSQSADALSTTQPALSKWLKELEEDIGLPLFERHARGLRPTKYGASLVEHARRIEAHLNTARDDMQLMREEGAGLVTIGFSGASSVDTVPMAVLRIVKELPNAHVQLLENKIEQLMDALAAGEVDVVVGPSEMVATNPMVRSETLYAEPIHLVARVEHPIFERESITWDDVLAYPLALWAKGTPVRKAFDRAIAEAGRKLPPNHIESNAATLTTTLLLHSDMVGVTSQRPALRYSRLKLLSLIPLNLGVLGSISLYWRDDALEREAVRAAVKAIREVVREFGTA